MFNQIIGIKIQLKREEKTKFIFCSLNLIQFEN